MPMNSHEYIIIDVFYRHIIVGSGKGRMNLIDLRKPSAILNTYKGFAGGVTGIACSTNNPFVASVSLDRYLRIHHIDTKELLKKVISSFLLCFPKYENI